MTSSNSSIGGPLRRYEGTPRNLNALNVRIRNCLATKDPVLERRMRVTLANVIVGQMLPDGAVKGGTAMKLRLGHEGSRFTPDLDTARRDGEREFLSEFRVNLDAGWNGFTGRIVPRSAPRPAGIPTEYVMTPYDVKVAFNGKSWHTVTVELGHNEIGDADDPEYHLAPDIIEWFVALGLPSPAPIAVMRADHQIAQKLHACSSPESERAHDLVDLQLLAEIRELNLSQVRGTAERLFTYRQAHEWPPTIVAGAEWGSIYAEAADGLPVLRSVEEAVSWANGFIAGIVGSNT
ncbi:nucleotidyl transferase AbiEii/AbiGii toxin family protein [soil metagenome]